MAPSIPVAGFGGSRELLVTAHEDEGHPGEGGEAGWVLTGNPTGVWVGRTFNPIPSHPIPVPTGRDSSTVPGCSSQAWDTPGCVCTSITQGFVYI